MLVPDDVTAWIHAQIDILQPSKVEYITGSKEEYQSIIKDNPQVFMPLKNENRYIVRSHPNDVARLEKCTYICTNFQSDAGPTNNWKHPVEMKNILTPLFTGSMSNKTMYVIPFCMGHIGSKFALYGIQLTDSPYVVANMHHLCRIGMKVIEYLTSNFIKCIHSVGCLDDIPWPCNDTKYICHFPEELSVYSFGSGYGGNALLGKKCVALRLASVLARKEGWFAEHMFICSVTNPEGKKKYFLGAFPSACGKTNLSMLKSSLPGWEVKLIGDDIAWIRVDKGRMYAINPENGFFGVAPGSTISTNPNVLELIENNTIFTNTGVTPEGDPCWEGLNVEKWTNWENIDNLLPMSHPNARFTTSLSNYKYLDDEWNNPNGVPVSGIIFGGRRSDVVPLVTESFDWDHGVYMGASLSSEATAASEAKGVRYDPFAMLPFCGYNMSDYFKHWLDMNKKITHKPKFFTVNWFRKDENGKFLWKGFGENINVLKWMFERIDNDPNYIITPIGYMPKHFDAPNELFEIDRDAYEDELLNFTFFLTQFGDNVPNKLIKVITRILLNIQC